MINALLIGLGFLALLATYSEAMMGLFLLGALFVLIFILRKTGKLTSRINILEGQLKALSEQQSAKVTTPATASTSTSISTQESESVTGDEQSARAESTEDSDDKLGNEPTLAVEPELNRSVEAHDASLEEESADRSSDELTESKDPQPASIAARQMASASSSKRVSSDRLDPVGLPADELSSTICADGRSADNAAIDWLGHAMKALTASMIGWVTGGNVFVRLGVAILFLGMTFLIRYTVGQGLIPIEFRLAGVAAAAIGLLYWGWTQRAQRSQFSVVVQGGGIGLLFLTVFASFSLYQVIDSTPAFMLLILIVILASILAVLQDAISLALFATVAGFITPILVSSGSNNFIGLFSYYTVLNLGIFAIAWFKSWRLLNLSGFIFTFAISGIWGLLSYTPEDYSATQPFLIIFFLMYVVVSILFALNQPLNFKDKVDSSLVFGTPLLAFGMQCELAGDYQYGIALSAFTLAIFYCLLAYFLWKRYSQRLALLCETFLSLAVIFASLAIPFAIDGSLTGMIWAIEGAGILWVSIRQQQFYRRLFAVALILASGLILGWELVQNGSAIFVAKSVFINSAFFSTTLISLAAVIGSWLLYQTFNGKKSIEKELSFMLLGFSVSMSLVGFELQIFEFAKYQPHGNLLAAFSLINGLFFLAWAWRFDWRIAGWLSLGYFALLVPAAGLSILNQDRLAQNFGYWLWPLALIGLFFALQRLRGMLLQSHAILVHGMGALILLGLLFWEGLWQLLSVFTLCCLVFTQIGIKTNWRELRFLSLLLLPVLAFSALSAILTDGNLLVLSNHDSLVYPPVSPGYFLWLVGFIALFYILRKDPLLEPKQQVRMYLGGAVLISLMLLWLGLWPLLLGSTLLCWVAYYAAVKIDWPEMRKLSLLLLPLMIVVPIVGLVNGISNPSDLIAFNLSFSWMSHSGTVLWPLAFATLYLMAWLAEKEEQAYLGLHHAVIILFFVVLSTWQISENILDSFSYLDVTHLATMPIVGLAVFHLIGSARTWPFSQYQAGFKAYAIPPLMIMAVVWSFLQLSSSGGGLVIPWLPLINPIDLMQVAILGSLVLRRMNILEDKSKIFNQRVVGCLAGFVFIWINVDLLRLVHHWAGVDWDFSALIQSDLSQTLFSLTWSLMGLAGTFYATRKGQRQIWLVAAALLAIVVVKLFLIDLSAQGTIERIISFTGVGLLLTVVGYLAPIPPRHARPTSLEQPS